MFAVSAVRWLVAAFAITASFSSLLLLFRWLLWRCPRGMSWHLTVHDCGGTQALYRRVSMETRVKKIIKNIFSEIYIPLFCFFCSPTNKQKESCPHNGTPSGNKTFFVVKNSWVKGCCRHEEDITLQPVDVLRDIQTTAILKGPTRGSASTV